MTKRAFAALFCFLVVGFARRFAQQPKYPFNDPNLPEDKRIDNLLSLMTTEEKIDVLGTRTGVPRLGVPNIGSSEGIHGMVQREARFGRQPITTTQFPQPPGMGDRGIRRWCGRRAAWRGMRRGTSPRPRSTTARF